jgi:hypothetical protein
MATEKQIAANRRNARRSTGPRTARGKSFSRRNGFLHGLRSKAIHPPEADPRTLARQRKRLRYAWHPKTAAQTQLVEEMAVQRCQILYWERQENELLSLGIPIEKIIVLYDRISQRQARHHRALRKAEAQYRHSQPEPNPEP